MNHPNPYFNPHSFAFLPQNPNPNPISNPNPNSHYALPQPPQPLLTSTSTSDTIYNSPSNLDLQTTISMLKNFIDNAQNTLKSVSDLLCSGQPTFIDRDFSTCPFDSHHRMPPEFLFRHYLQCPSSPGMIDLGLLEPLRYPNSLKSEEELLRENQVVRPLQDSDSDLFFSLDDYEDVGANFFYRDCPGVVSSSEQDASRKTFILPSALSVECANFIRKGGDKIEDLGREDLGILPSELWALRSEVDLWSEIPSSYSYTVCRVAMRLQMIREADVLKWVISNSPFYGIVIDVPMRDHIFLLLKLCLKAVSREALHSSELLSSTDTNQEDGNLNPKSLAFQCPVLVEVMMWLSSQLSILYGETNGRLFSVNMLKHCLLNAASRSLLFSLTPKRTILIGSVEGNSNFVASVSDMSGQTFDPEATVDAKDKQLHGNDSASTGLIFTSQVAAAIAALHERSLLEGKIKRLRFAVSLPKFRLIAEHSYLSSKANEERQKRPSYHPVLEHDGLYWQHSRNQDSGKVKTVEELLAEERDYKRRRASYRGKKVKRSTTQVMHDIIEEQMEAIKQAGGIGCSLKAPSDVGMSHSGSFSACDMAKDVNEPKKGAFGITVRPNDQLSLNNGLKSSQRQRSESLEHHETPEDRKRSIHRESRDTRHDREYSFGSPESYRSHGRSHERRPHERYRHQREHDDENMGRSKYDGSSHSSSHRSRQYDNTPMSSESKSLSDANDRKHRRLSDTKDRSKERRHRSNLSDSMTQDTFEDRYNPSELYDRYDPM